MNRRPTAAIKKKVAPPKATAPPGEPVASAVESSDDKDTANRSEF